MGVRATGYAILATVLVLICGLIIWTELVDSDPGFNAGSIFYFVCAIIGVFYSIREVVRNPKQ